jgi:hypothetical protein
MSPYERGWMDAERGKSLRDCPYHPASGSAISWRWGYRAMLESIGLAA